MRHVGTLIAAVVVAPLAWVLLAFGQGRSVEAFADAQRTGVFQTGDLVRSLELLAAAGLLLGLIATLRFSPAGALLAGAVYVSSYTLMLVVPDGLLRLLGHDLSVAGHHADPSLPVRTGTTPLLGTLLLVGALSVGRWRRWPRPADGDAFDSTTDWDRPLGADGLGLIAPRSGLDPEVTVRYPTRPAPAMSGGGYSSWTDSPPGSYEGYPS